MPDDEGSCAVCKAAAKQKCSGCHMTYYCSREHQKQHWKTHKYECSPIKVAHDPVLGRYLTTTRDVKYGNIVYRENPLVSGPSHLSPPVCLSCFKVLTKDRAQECSLCGWPMCSEICTTSPNHRPECEWTARRGEKVHIRDYGIPNPNYQLITILRCLYLKTSQPDVWNKLEALESHCERRKLTPKWESDRIQVAQFMRSFYRLENDFTEDEIMRVLGIVQVNGHEIPLSELPHVAVYDKVSMLEHNCRSNCAKTFSSSGDIVLIAATNIPKGSHLSICYSDPMWGTDSRRYHLAETKFFDCSCDRCRDVTELKSMFSAVKCREKDCSGYLLPKSFIDEEKDFVPSSKTNERIERKRCWYCSKCTGQVNDSVIQDMIDHIGRDLVAMDKGSSDCCERFISHCSKYLHPSHQYMVDVGIALAQLIGQECDLGLAGTTDEKLTLKSELCRRFANVVGDLIPAEFRIRGTLLFELHAAIAERGRRSSVINGPDVLIPYLIESKKVLEEAVFLLKHEPPELPEGKVGRQAVKNLKDIQALLKKITATIGESPG